LLLQGTPTASAGPAPAVNGQVITWAGDVVVSGTVTIEYAARLTGTVETQPVVINAAQINDGDGNIYIRRAFVNGHHLFLPLIRR